MAVRLLDEQTTQARLATATREKENILFLFVYNVLVNLLIKIF